MTATANKNPVAVNLSKPRSGEVLVALFPNHAHDPLDWIIKFLTHGRASHAAFVRGNGKIIENFWPHVRERCWMPHEASKVQLYRVAVSTPADWARLERWFDSELARPPRYSIINLFRYALNLPPIKGDSCFCSQFVCRGLRLNLADFKQPLVRLEYQDFASPVQLLNSPRLIRVYVEGISEH